MSIASNFSFSIPVSTITVNGYSKEWNANYYLANFLKNTYNRQNRKGVCHMQYENLEKLNKQGLWFTVIHTLIIFSFALDFGFFA